MQAYDTVLTGSFYALPAFQKQFGHRLGQTDKYQLTPQWQTSLCESLLVSDSLYFADDIQRKEPQQAL